MSRESQPLVKDCRSLWSRADRSCKLDLLESGGAQLMQVAAEVSQIRNASDSSTKANGRNRSLVCRLSLSNEWLETWLNRKWWRLIIKSLSRLWLLLSMAKLEPLDKASNCLGLSLSMHQLSRFNSSRARSSCRACFQLKFLEKLWGL